MVRKPKQGGLIVDRLDTTYAANVGSTKIVPDFESKLFMYFTISPQGKELREQAVQNG